MWKSWLFLLFSCLNGIKSSVRQKCFTFFTTQVFAPATQAVDNGFDNTLLSWTICKKHLLVTDCNGRPIILNNLLSIYSVLPQPFSSSFLSPPAFLISWSSNSAGLVGLSDMESKYGRKRHGSRNKPNVGFTVREFRTEASQRGSVLSRRHLDKSNNNKYYFL